MNITLKQALSILLYIIFSISNCLIYGNANTMKKWNPIQLNIKNYKEKPFLVANVKLQSSRTIKSNYELTDKKRNSNVKKRTNKQGNPSKLRYIQKRTKAKINRKNGVNRCYII